MSNSDEGRKCKLDGRSKIYTFKRFGNEIVYGGDNEPRTEAMAYAECDETGKIEKVKPEQVTFIK